MRKLGLLSLIICAAFAAFALAHFLPRTDNKRADSFKSKKQMLAKSDKQVAQDKLLSRGASLPAPLARADEALAYQDAKTLSKNPDSDQSFLKALEAYNERRYRDVYKISQKALPFIEANTKDASKWLHLLISTALKLEDATQLTLFYEFQNEPFIENERAALIVAKNYIHLGNKEKFQEIASLFPKNARSDEWTLLESDLLLLENRRPEAVGILQDNHFQGPQEIERLLRLSLFHIRENPKQAWKFLQEANKLDPNNTEVISYLGKLMELAGQKEKALSYYFMAWNHNPENPKLRDQLADFYLRNRQFSRALNIWKENLDSQSDESAWIKALFLSRVIKPAALPDKAGNEPASYSDYLYSLKPWEFWNEPKLEKFKLKDIDKKEQSAFWLKLLHNLNQKNENLALEMIENNPFKRQSWSPFLEHGLKRVLTFRKTGFFSLDENQKTQDDLKILEEIREGKTHPFFKEIELAKESEDHLSSPKRNFFRGNLALPALFLAAGWNEAALELLSGSFKTDETPIWVAASLVSATNENHGLRQALLFSKQLPDTAELRLLKAELLLDGGSPKDALEVLSGLNSKFGEEGRKAAFLEVAAYLDLGEYSVAELAIHDNPELQSSLLGKELLGRIALQKGQEEKAEEIYEGIINHSFEAKAFLAKKAYEKGNFEACKNLTLELLEKDPGNTVLKENLQRIKWHLNADSKKNFP